MYSGDLLNSAIKNNPVLSSVEQLSLIVDWQENANKSSLDKLVLSNMKIISREASKIRSKNYFVSYEDLLQEGIAGLLKAASMFDSAQEVTFLTYAMWWVRANMKKHVMDYKSVVKMGTTRDDRTLFSNLSKTVKEAEGFGLSGEDVFEYVAKKLSVKRSSLDQMMNSLKGTDLRLDMPLKSSDDSVTTRLDLMEDSHDYHKVFEDTNELSSFSKALSEIVPTMPELERKIIENRFLAEEPKTLRELESELDISREWVRRVEKRAIERLRKRLKVQFGIGEINV
tara:strand:- start:110 stop:961 length:852 start_codon:yes stop_codon:yes gene_type:complete